MKIFPFILLALNIAFIQPAFSQELAVSINKDVPGSYNPLANVPTLTIEGKSYTYGQIYSDFMDAAFSDSLWIEDEVSRRDPKNKGKMIDWYLQANQADPHSAKAQDANSLRLGVKKNVPWFAKHVEDHSEISKGSVLHRWQGKIIVAVGWPNFPPVPEKELSKIYSSWNQAEAIAAYAKTHAILEKYVQTLRENTGLDIILYTLGDERDASKNYARLRIVPEVNWQSRNWFDASGITYSMTDYEKLLWNAIPFEDNAPNVTDGYFLPLEDGEIDFAACRVNTELKDDEYGHGIAKCLIRSLGFPNISENQFSRLSKNTNLNPVGIMDYDLRLIKLLYCSRLHTGMTKVSVLNAFAENPNCISTDK